MRISYYELLDPHCDLMNRASILEASQETWEVRNFNAGITVPESHLYSLSIRNCGIMAKLPVRDSAPIARCITALCRPAFKASPRLDFREEGLCMIYQ